jgi:hypothetical protein
MGYRIEWLVDNDRDAATFTNSLFNKGYDEEDRDEILDLANGEEWGGDPAIHWQGSTDSEYELAYAKKLAADWQNSPDAWKIARITNNDTGEVEWTSWEDGAFGDRDPVDEGNGPYKVRAVNRTRGTMDEQYFPEHATIEAAEAIVTSEWQHDAWEMHVVDQDGTIVSRTTTDGDWIRENTAESGEGPREGEDFGDYLARLRAREDADVL